MAPVGDSSMVFLRALTLKVFADALILEDMNHMFRTL